MPCRELDGFPGADEQSRVGGQIAEDLPGEGHRCECDGDRARTDGGIGAHPFGDEEGLLKQLPQQRSQGAGALCRPVGGFELAENLGLADHHGIQSTGHPHDMAHGAVRLMDIHVALEFSAAESVVGQEPVSDRLVGAVLQAKIQVCPVTGREDGRLLDAFAAMQLTQGLGQLLGTEYDPLAHAHRRRLMVHSTGEEGHLKVLTRDAKKIVR